MTTENKRHELGEATLSAITGGTGTAVVESLKDIAPDLAEWILVFVRLCHGAPGARQAVAPVCYSRSINCHGHGRAIA